MTIKITTTGSCASRSPQGLNVYMVAASKATGRPAEKHGPALLGYHSIS